MAMYDRLSWGGEVHHSSLVLFLYFTTGLAWTTKTTTPSSLNVLPYRRTPSSSSCLSMVDNVVLRTGHQSFDCYKIGSPRVHCYEDEDDVYRKNFVMWYHGRDEAMNSETDLPPLSTGRIGRATSTDGLQWVRDGEDMYSESAAPCCLGPDDESWWAFDTVHVGLGQVVPPMDTPALATGTGGGVYWMYYMGGNHEETPISEFLEGDFPPEKTVRSMKTRIGVAISQDGKMWGRIEGDDPSGAVVVPFQENQERSSGDVVVEDELYCGWPDVVVNPSDGGSKGSSSPSPFTMFYSCMTAQNKQKCIARAVSEDGMRWFQRGVCLRPQNESDDATEDEISGVSRCHVVPEMTYEVTTQRWLPSGSKAWTMYYEGVSKKDNRHRIYRARSTDYGQSWTKTGQVVWDVGTGTDENGHEWDAGGVGSPHVLHMDDGTLRMYYTGQGTDGTTAIGVARTAKTTSSSESAYDLPFSREEVVTTFA